MNKNWLKGNVLEIVIKSQSQQWQLGSAHILHGLEISAVVIKENHKSRVKLIFTKLTFLHMTVD